MGHVTDCKQTDCKYSQLILKAGWANGRERRGGQVALREGLAWHIS